MHNGMVNVGGEKMSKSLGNFTTIRQLLNAPHGPDPMAVRLFLLQAQYRKPVDFTEESIIAAENSWRSLKTGMLFGYEFGERLGWPDTEDTSFGDPVCNAD
jgi:cysteinyl-tRNA synthetase